jgi:glycosyltransferase involved in cell wall biosynthesis
MAIAAGVPPERVWLFRNVEDVGEIVRWEGSGEGEFVVTFAGGFGPHRGIDTLIAAMPYLVELVPNARLLLIGSGSNDTELRTLAGELGVSDRVEFTGWIGIDEMRERLARSSVGTAPFTRSAHTDTMLPHKLFQYMGMGLPVVVTDCKPVARVVHETGAGEVARSGDAVSVARALARLADPERARAASEAGKRAVAERYNLAIEGMRLRELYESLPLRVSRPASSE